MKTTLEKLGRFFLLLSSVFSKPEKFSMYWKETIRQMNAIGVGSLGIIAIISTFIGAVTAVQFAYQLMDIGFIPMWWMGTIVRKSMILEMAPTISALLLAGKVGSNIASELGTMRITEQIDALEIMGVNTRAYLVAPKIIAGVLIMPSLVVVAVFLGILGGMGAGLMGGLFSVAEYVRGLQDGLDDYSVLIMIIKALCFALIITSISCYEGYYVKGGALQIGEASTRAVVYSSIVVIVANFLIAFLFL